jgi:hypothetical protein
MPPRGLDVWDQGKSILYRQGKSSWPIPVPPSRANRGCRPEHRRPPVAGKNAAGSAERWFPEPIRGISILTPRGRDLDTVGVGVGRAGPSQSARTTWSGAHWDACNPAEGPKAESYIPACRTPAGVRRIPEGFCYGVDTITPLGRNLSSDFFLAAALHQHRHSSAVPERFYGG